MLSPRAAQRRLFCVSWVQPMGVERKGEARLFLPLSSCLGSFSASSCLSRWAPSCGSSFCQEPLGRWALETSLHSLCPSSLSGGQALAGNQFLALTSLWVYT